MAPIEHSSHPRRIYFVGAHATGKTTLARYVRDRYNLPLISEVARSILAEMEIGLERLRSHTETVNRYQLEVFRRQIQAEREAGNEFVSDRAFCNLAYTANHGTIMHEIFRDPALDEYMRWVAAGCVFFVRPHQELVIADGVRAGLRWEDVVMIDGMVKLLLEMYAIPYIIVASLEMQERVRLVDEVIRLRHPDLSARARARSRGARSESGFPSTTEGGLHLDDDPRESGPTRQQLARPVTPGPPPHPNPTRHAARARREEPLAGASADEAASTTQRHSA